MIAYNKFPFFVDQNNIILPEYFEKNEDFKINFEKRIKSLKNILVDIILSLDKAEYEIFKDFLIKDIQNSRKLFYMNLEVFGKTEDFLVDIIENIQVSFSNNIYNIKFKVAIK